MSTARFTKGLIIASGAAGVPLLQLIHAGATPLAVFEISLTLTAATATTLGLSSTATLGTGSTFVNGISENGMGAVSTAKIYSAWTVNPTVSANGYIEKQYLPGIQGANVAFEWDARSPLIVSPNSSLVLWNIGLAASSELCCNIRFSEEARICGERFIYSNQPGDQ